MATDLVLQWRTHVTDSTDQDTILGNLDFLEQFALSINGGDGYTIEGVEGLLSTQFENIRTKIKNGTLKPTEWKDSTELEKITTALTNSSSGKISTLTEQLGTAEENITDHGTRISDAETALGKKLDSTDFSAFKEGDFKTTTESLGTRLDTAEGSITDHTTRITDAEGSIKNYGPRITSAEGSIKSHGTTLSGYGTRIGNAESSIKSHGTTLSGYGTRISDAETALGEKLDSTDFDSFKSSTNSKLGTLASRTELENVKTLLNKEVSHWTAESTPAPLEYTASAKVKDSTQPWGEGEDPEPHADDLCTVIGEKATNKGVSYRFIKHPTADSYKWLKVIDNDGALALGNLETFKENYNQRQEDIDNALKNKQRKGNYVEKTDFEENNTKVDQEIQELKGTYKVTVTTQGEIRNGEIIGGTTHDSKPAILHTAHVYGILGNKITDTEIINKLTWTVNSGRTTSPEQRTVTGATCYVTAKDFVRVLHTQGSTPQYYDIELNSSF